MSTIFPTSLDSFLNPSSTTNLDSSGSDPRLRHSTQHDNINDSVTALEGKVGVNFSAVTASLDYIVTLLLLTSTQHGAGIRRDLVGGAFPTSVIWYSDAGGTIKLVEKRYTYNSKHLITKIELFLYDGSVGNILKRTITDNITLTGPFETTRTRAVT